MNDPIGKMRLKIVVVHLTKTGLSREYTKRGVEYRKLRRTKITNTSFGLSIILSVRLYPYGGVGYSQNYLLSCHGVTRIR